MWSSENSAFRDSPESGLAWCKAENLLGDLPALLQQVGVRGMFPTGDSSVTVSSSQIVDLPSLQVFLKSYLEEILVPLEFPVIAEACSRVGHGETRELIALDQRVSNEARLAPFAAASHKIGAMQLQRLKPLRGERTVRRYLDAVESGQAEGWHTLVYGLTLAVYSFPLRQGLLHYGRETLSGLARAAAGPKKFLKPACQEMLEPILGCLPEAIEKTLVNCARD